MELINATFPNKEKLFHTHLRETTMPEIHQNTFAKYSLLKQIPSNNKNTQNVFRRIKIIQKSLFMAASANVTTFSKTPGKNNFFMGWKDHMTYHEKHFLQEIEFYILVCKFSLISRRMLAHMRMFVQYCHYMFANIFTFS